MNSYPPRLSGVPDPTFDDWFNLREDFSSAFVHVGNTRRLGLGAGGVLAPGSVITSEDFEDIDPDQFDYEQANGPIDVETPAIDIIAPPSGSNVAQGTDLTVTVSATDNVALGLVMVSFDIDGSGAIDATGETVVALSSGPDEFEAVFSNVMGPSGNRDIKALVSDPSGNVGQDIEPIFVPEPSVVIALAVAVPLLGLLGRHRGRGRHRTPHSTIGSACVRTSPEPPCISSIRVACGSAWPARWLLEPRSGAPISKSMRSPWTFTCKPTGRSTWKRR